MANQQSLHSETAIGEASVTPTRVRTAPLDVRQIELTDIREALAKGLEDFSAQPSHVIFLCVIYPIVGILLGGLVFGNEMVPILFPLMAGFALIGPFAAIGLYEISRRREMGLESTWDHAFDVLRSPSIVAIATLGVVLLGIFFAWLAVAMLLYNWTFGGEMPASITGFVREIFTTRAGWTLLVVGNAVGFVFALASLLISVVSFPLLLDRRISLMAAVKTSLRAARENPVMILVWGFIVAALLVVGSLPFFVGLAVVMPVLGHATWHLYRRLVER